MKNNLFTAVPISKNKTATFRRKIKSSDFNEKQDKVLNDLLELYNKANSLNSSLQDTIITMDYENKFLKRKLNELESKLEEAKELDICKKLTVFASDMKSDEDYPVEINYMANDLSQEILARISKVNIYDEVIDKTIVPSSLDVSCRILNKTNAYLIYNTNDIFNAFDGNDATSWMYQITTNNSINSVQVELIITIPDSIVTSYNINEIIIEAFPVSSVDIKELKYRSSYVTWTDIPSFYEHYENDGEGIKDSTIARFNFKPVNANQIKVILEQSYFANKNNLREFCLGAKNIQINYTKACYHQCFFSCDLNIPKKFKNPVLTEANIVYNNPKQIGDNVIELEYYYRDNDDVLHRINGHLPLNLPSNNIEVKGKVYQDDNTINLSHIDFFIGEQ